MPACAVELNGVKVVYGPQTVLDLPALEFAEGRIHVLVGPNGSGKTTLLRIAAGLLRPTDGEVKVFGQELHRLRGGERIQLARRLTLCFQRPYLFNASVRRNIEYGLRCRGLGVRERHDRTQAAAEALDLSALSSRNARTLSAGESQRVSLARAMVLQPELVLLDEPVANVDRANRSRVEEAIMGLHASGRTVIVATHHVDQAYRLSADVVRLEAGRIAHAAIENLLEGEIAQRDGAAVLLLGNRASIYVVSDTRGPARAAIDPANIIISKEEIQSSARNCFAGRIVALSELGKRVALSVDVGATLTAHITRESFASLGVTLGSEVFATFKASAVTVF